MVWIRPGRSAGAPSRNPESSLANQPQWFLDQVVDKNASEGLRLRTSYAGVNSRAEEKFEDKPNADGLFPDQVELLEAFGEKCTAMGVDEDEQEIVGVAKKGKGKASEVAGSVATEKVVSKEVEESAATENAVTMEEEGEDEGFFSEDEVEEEPEEEPARQKRKYEKKGKKPRKTRPSPLAGMFNGSSPTSKDAARKIKEQNRAAVAKYDFSWVTINDAYEILGLALTSDSSKALLFGDVFFDPQVFETPFVVDALYKLLPYDAAELGVEPGTKICVETSEGMVKSVQHGDVVVEVGRKERQETVLFVVRHAMEGSGVTSLEDVERKFLLHLQAIIVITHIQYPEHALVDLKKKDKRKNAMSTDFVEAMDEIEDLRQDDGELTGSRKRKLRGFKSKKGVVEKVNSMSWSVMRDIAAIDTVRVKKEEEREDGFSKEFEAFLGQKHSFLEMLGLKRFKDVVSVGPDVPNFGFFGKMEEVNTDIANVTNLSKALQAAFKMNRFVNLPSVLFPLTSKDYDKVFPNMPEKRQKDLAAEKKKKTSKWWGVGTQTKAAEALLSLGSIYYPNLPVGAFPVLTRHPKLGDLKHVGAYYSSQSRFFDIYDHSSTLACDTRDAALFKQVRDEFGPILTEKRDTSEIRNNNDGQLGDSTKVMRGRILEDVWFLQALIRKMVASLMEKVVKVFVSKIPEAYRNLCWDVLVKEGLGEPGTRTNEDHLKTPAVQAAARYVTSPDRKELQVTCKDVSLLSAALCIIDSVTSSPVRRQAKYGQFARNTLVHKHDGRLTDVLPDHGKNAKTKRKEGIKTIRHIKHRMIEKEYAVLVVLGRAVLREHRFKLDKTIGPLSSKGEMFGETRRSSLFKKMGEQHLHIPYFGEHILRTYQMSMQAQKCVSRGVVPEQDLETITMVNDMDGSMVTTMKFYNQLKYNSTTQRASIYDIAFEDVVEKVSTLDIGLEVGGGAEKKPGEIPTAFNVREISFFFSFFVSSLVLFYQHRIDPTFRRSPGSRRRTTQRERFGDQRDREGLGCKGIRSQRGGFGG